jgi:hypothetical protein
MAPCVRVGHSLLNEPYALRWSSWVRAVERLGDHVLSKCPRWLIFVEGTGNEEPAEPGIEWGENFLGVAQRPIKLSNDSKLVYSPHVYGPGLFAANNLPEPEYMGDKEFPISCRSVWQRHFGFVKKQTGRPVIIGETGGKYNLRRDAEWQEEFVDWAIQAGIGLFYFALVCVRRLARRLQYACRHAPTHFPAHRLCVQLRTQTLTPLVGFSLKIGQQVTSRSCTCSAGCQPLFSRAS